MAEVFQDGEPVDPIKLQSLQDQINQIDKIARQAFDLSSTTTDSGVQETISVVRGGSVTFDSITGQAKSEAMQIEKAWGGEFTSAYTVATPVTNSTKTNKLIVSVSGDWKQPTIRVYSDADSKTTIKDLQVNWVSVGVKPASSS